MKYVYEWDERIESRDHFFKRWKNGKYDYCVEDDNPGVDCLDEGGKEGGEIKKKPHVGDASPLSLCPNCGCMTKTIIKKEKHPLVVLDVCICGKCGEVKE